MDIATVLAQLRNKRGYTQIEAADFISRRSGKPYSHKAVAFLVITIWRAAAVSLIYETTGISTVIMPTVISGTCATTSAFGFIACVGP